MLFVHREFDDQFDELNHKISKDDYWMNESLEKDNQTWWTLMEFFADVS